MAPRTPLMLITGSLGSGKTTLLRRILDSTTLRIAVLMNEFGELAIDSKVISGRNIDIVELAGGCVCCSMTGEFEAAVREVVETIRPDHIVVEATGVAESDALVFEVEDNLAQVRLDSVVCIVDTYLAVRYPYVGYTLRTQIASADIILINKVDQATTAETRMVETRVRDYNDRATFIRTINCDVDSNLLFAQTSGRRVSSLFSPSGPPAPFAKDKFDSFTWTAGKTLDRTKFDLLVRELPSELIRAKGFVCFEDGCRLFNYVVGRIDFEKFDADRTELVFIGPGLDRLRTEIEHRLHECEINAV